MKIISKFFVAAIGILAALCLASCEKKQVLKLYSWTYYTPTDVVEAFEKEFDCKVIVTEYDSNETMFNKLVNGGSKSFDIVVPSQDYVSIMIAWVDDDKLDKICFNLLFRKNSQTGKTSILLFLQK